MNDHTPCVIINADDFGLTKGVSHAILKAIDEGCVTSTSVFVTSPKTEAYDTLRTYHDICSIGIHLSITYGHPVRHAEDVASLVDSAGMFSSSVRERLSRVSLIELRREWEAQLDRFRTYFKTEPTHIDTHHHIHEDERIYSVVHDLAKQRSLPLRRQYVGSKNYHEDVITSAYVHVRYDPGEPWTRESFHECLLHLRPGTHEVVVHPGFNDAELAAVSSFTDAREQEYALVQGQTFTELEKQYCIKRATFKDLV